jgi:hypothetical protein
LNHFNLYNYFLKQDPPHFDDKLHREHLFDLAQPSVCL